MFENDVKIYGIQTILTPQRPPERFENDVKIYGIQTDLQTYKAFFRLRMM